MAGPGTRRAGRRCVVALFVVLGASAVAGCALPDDPSDGIAASTLRNDTSSTVRVQICSDARCASLEGTVTDVVAPGQSDPVNVATDGSGEYYAVMRPGEPTRCLAVPAHPYASTPTLRLSAATPCPSTVPAGSADRTTVAGWLFLIAVGLASVLGWVLIIRWGVELRRWLVRRRINDTVAVLLAVLAPLLVGSFVWPVLVVWFAGRLVRKRWGRTMPSAPTTSGRVGGPGRPRSRGRSRRPR
jgi:hypothetical protein